MSRHRSWRVIQKPFCPIVNAEYRQTPAWGVGVAWPVKQIYRNDRRETFGVYVGPFMGVLQLAIHAVSMFQWYGMDFIEI